jgi:hypothetical protein
VAFNVMQRRLEFGDLNNETRHGSAAGICTRCHTSPLPKVQNRRRGHLWHLHLKANPSRAQISCSSSRQRLCLPCFCLLHIRYAQALTRLFTPLSSFNMPYRVCAFRFEIQPTSQESDMCCVILLTWMSRLSDRPQF